jgi:transcriptional regulator with XRE-family HTH domain
VDKRKKPVSRDELRRQRDELYAAISRGELTIQEAVKRMRRLARMTQVEFAAHRGLSLKVIKDVERGVGNPTLATLNKIGEIFGLEVAFVRKDKLQSAASKPVVAADLGAAP